MDYSAAALAGAAGIDPWALQRNLSSGSPEAIRDAGALFRRAGGLAGEAVDLGRAADRTVAGAFRNNGAGVFDAVASTAAGSTLMGERGDRMEETARALLDVADALVDGTSRSAQRLSTLDTDIDHVVALRNNYFAANAAVLTPAAADDAEQRYHQMAVDAVRIAAGVIQIVIDEYDAVLANRASRIADIGYGTRPTPDTAPASSGSGLLSGLADFGADLGNAVASFGNALVHNPEAAAGLVLGIGATVVGGATVAGGGGLSLTGAGAIAGVPAAAAGAALVGTGGALVVASSGDLVAAAAGADRVTPFESGSAEGPPVRETVADYFEGGAAPNASELEDYAQAQGWQSQQTPTGPVKYVDENGVVRMTLKEGSARTPGSETPHVELRNADGLRVDPEGQPVTRRSPANHSPITWDR